MRCILSNRKNNIPLTQLIELCKQYNADMEVFLTYNQLQDINVVSNKYAFYQFINEIKSSGVKLNGICIENELDMGSGSLNAKNSVALLRNFTGGYVRLCPNIEESYNIYALAGFINQIARYASFRTGGGRGEGLVSIVSNMPPDITPTQIFEFYNSLRFKCSGLLLNPSITQTTLEKLISEFNQHESTLQGLVVSENTDSETINLLCENACKVYNGAMIIELENGDKIDNIINIAKTYKFDDNLYDYSKMSCPSSVSRIIRNAGTATLTPSDIIIAKDKGTWKYTFTVGVPEIAVRGGFKFCFNHASDSDDFQVHNPKGRQYVSVTTKNECKTEVFTGHEDACQILYVKLIDGALNYGDTVTVIYGDRTQNAPPFEMQSHQCKRMMFYSFVDITGNGHYFAQSFQPYIEVIGDRAVKIVAYAPSYVKCGESFDISVLIEDKYHNCASSEVGNISLKLNGQKVNAEKEVTGNSNVIFKNITLVENDVYLFTISSDTGLTGDTNFVTVNDTGLDENGYKLYFGDIHGHVSVMDGYGSIGEYYDFAKNTSYLDFVCHSEHMDSYSGNRQSSNDMQWHLIFEGARKHNIKNKFVTLLGYENSDDFGDVNVYFDYENDEFLKKPWRACSSINELVDFAKKNNAILIPHMTTYPQRLRGFDWRNYDKDTMPAMEIYSCHGASEYFGGEFPLNFCESGGYAVDALNAGCKIGFIGSGDGHECMPGNANFGGRINGLVGVYVKELTRKEIIKAIKERRCFATTNIRINASFSINDVFMGGDVTVKNEPIHIKGKILAVNELESVNLCCDGSYIKEFDLNGRICQFDFIHNLEIGEHYYYIKVKQKDGNLAWLSPVFITVQQ